MKNISINTTSQHDFKFLCLIQGNFDIKIRLANDFGVYNVEIKNGDCLVVYLETDSLNTRQNQTKHDAWT